MYKVTIRKWICLISIDSLGFNIFIPFLDFFPYVFYSLQIHSPWKDFLLLLLNAFMRFSKFQLSKDSKSTKQPLRKLKMIFFSRNFLEIVANFELAHWKKENGKK